MSEPFTSLGIDEDLRLRTEKHVAMDGVRARRRAGKGAVEPPRTRPQRILFQSLPERSAVTRILKGPTPLKACTRRGPELATRLRVPRDGNQYPKNHANQQEIDEVADHLPTHRTLQTLPEGRAQSRRLVRPSGLLFQVDSDRLQDCVLVVFALE